MKRALILAFAIVLAAAFYGCGQPSQQTQEKWTVTFVDDDGSVIETAETSPSSTGSTVYCPLDVKKEGYILAGWETDAPEDKARVKETTQGGSYLATVFADGVTVKAIWRPAKTFTVTFTDGDGNVLETAKVVEGETAESPAIPTKDGLIFAGWDTSTFGITEDKTINATWNAAWTVTFTDGEGNNLSTETVENGKAAKAPSTPKRDGYDFSGWDTDFSNVTNNMTVNAVWKIKPTAGMNNALRSAKSYLNTMPFSYTGLIQQLEYEKYSHDEAVYAADNCGADWNEQAAKSAKSYLKTMPFSRDGLIDQLQYEGFTYDQAVYGVDKTGL